VEISSGITKEDAIKIWNKKEKKEVVEEEVED
jgi:predicted GIY-YIG superfamily endonuclease